MSNNRDVDLIEVELHKKDYMMIKNLLRRIGIACIKEIKGVPEKVLFQSCHLLKKNNKHYLVSFKELLKLDGKHDSPIDEADLLRRKRVANLLEAWGYVTIVDRDRFVIEDINKEQDDEFVFVKVLKKEHIKHFGGEWLTIPKYKFYSERHHH